MGLCQLPDYIVQDEVASGELVELLPGFQPEPMPIGAVVPSGRLVPSRVRVALAALDALRERRAFFSATPSPSPRRRSGGTGRTGSVRT